MNPIVAAFYQPVKVALASVPYEEWPDIYAISFFIYDDEDDPRRPTLTVGFNTVANWKAKIPRASGSSEAKWNFAFWLQNEVLVLGREGTESAAWLTSWEQDLGLWYSDEDEERDFDACMELGGQITEHFVVGCCELAAKLHAEGDIPMICGRPLPILVHELEYYDEIADQTERANPPGIADEFVTWVRGLGA